MGYISTWERRGYPNGIPDEVETGLERSGRVPTYRRICMAIMKNDFNLLSLGFSRPTCRFYDALKKEELIKRGNIPVQLNLF